MNHIWSVLLLPMAMALTNSNEIGRNELSFSWVSCGNSSDVITVTRLDVNQNSSDNLYVTGTLNVRLNVTSPIQGKLEVKKRVLGVWISVPCVDNVGTCSYGDICGLTPYKTDCPEIYAKNGLPCRCPVTEGGYSFEELPVNLEILPKWLEKGLYSIRATLKWNEKRLMCIKMLINL